MRTQENKVLPSSNLYFHTASPLAKRLFFYPLCTGRFIYECSYDLKRSSYDSFLIMYIMHGTKYLEINGQTYPLTEGDFALVDCYHPHHYYTVDGCETLWLHFDGPMARTFFEELTVMSPVLPVLENSQPAQLLRKIYDIYNLRQDINEAKIHNLITALLTSFLENTISVCTQDVKASSSRSLGDTLSYIAEHIDSPLTVDELAERIFLSKYYFIRIFKKEVGYTPHEYIVITRVNYAAFLLKSTAFSIRNIALKCGFADESSFCTTFKRIMGHTPLKYRNSSKK